MKENPNMDTYASNERIDELLSSFIDGELTDRHRTEVQRLVSHDAQVAQRLRELQKCRMLVSSLPRAEAPADMAERIKTSLETRTLLGSQPSAFDERKGARHLLVRKVLTAAAMIALVAVLTALVYTIVTPETVAPPTGFRARLEVKTTNLIAVDAVIKKAIEGNDIVRHSAPGGRRDERVYALSCSREALSSLLADLENVWERFDSATLFVETKTPGRPVVVDNVSAEQIANLITPPKPRLTQHEKATPEPTSRLEDDKKIHLTIVVVGSE